MGPARPATGKRQQGSKGGFRTQKEAQQHLQEILPQVAAGLYAEPSKAPLSAFLTKEWLPAHRATVRPATWEAYERCIRNHVVSDEIGSLQLKMLSTGHVNALYARMLERGSAPATIHLVHSALHRALGDAVNWDKLTRNPATGATVPRKSGARVAAWTEGELKRFMEHVKGITFTRCGGSMR
jgi:site-specific recombinase XerC